MKKEKTEEELVKIHKILTKLTQNIQKLELKQEKELEDNSFKNKTYFDSKQTCKLLCISKNCLQKLRNNECLPFTRFSNKILYDADYIIETLKNNYHKSTH